MNVVTNAGAIRGVVITTKHGHRIASAGGGLENQRYQVGFRLMALAQLPVRVGPRSIEITQANRLQPVGTIEILKDLLDHPLAQPIRVDRCLAVRFVDGYIQRVAVHRSAGREHQPLDARIHHGLQQCQGSRYVVLIVLARGAHRLAHLNERREVEDRIEVAFGEQHIQRTLVGNVQLGPLHSRARRHEVRYHHIMTRGQQMLDHVRADIPCATDNQKLHPCLLDAAVVQTQ
ncbi:hypothetical protein D3C79_780880 [compost metagenome]